MMQVAGKIAALLGLSLALASCGSGSSNLFSTSALDLFSTSSKASGDTQAAGGSTSDIECPGISVRTGAATLMIGSKMLAPGEYNLFIDLKPNAWTLVVSTQAAQKVYDAANTTELWGAANYTPAKDVVRAPMTLGTLPVSIDQLTWNFTDMTDTTGKLTIMWDKVVASTPFMIH